MVARPDHIVSEIQRLGLSKQFMSRLALVDKNNDGILSKVQFMEAVTDNHALFSEFFDMYCENITNEPMIRVINISAKLLTIQESLHYKKMYLTLAKVRNTLMYRNLGLNYLFKESEMSFLDFCEAV